jgi:hypothetical protein
LFACKVGHPFRHSDPKAKVTDLLPPHLHEIRNLQLENPELTASVAGTTIESNTLTTRS